MNYRIAVKSDLQEIAMAHVWRPPSDSREKNVLMQNSQYGFYKDKVEFIYNSEPEGIIVAESDGSIAGFVIAISSFRRLRRLFFLKLVFIKWIFNSICGRYGPRRRMIQRFVLALIPYFHSIQKKILKMFIHNKSKSNTGIHSNQSNINTDAWIWSIIIEEKFRRQGIGYELLRLACDYLKSKGIEDITVGVHPSNLAAIKLYEKLGFVGIIGGKHILMTKKL